jgi:hypothetical protein
MRKISWPSVWAYVQTLSNIATGNYDLEVKNHQRHLIKKRAPCSISIFILILLLPDEQLDQDRQPSNTAMFGTGWESTLT